MSRRWTGLWVLASLLAGCGEGDDLGWWTEPLTALCTVTVTGKGLKQVETDYVPHVVACENGGADTEALKAQAVSARTYMYYKIKTEGGSICDGTSCQVYTCSNQPQAKHYAAASATAGQVLMYNNIVICAFYVAGAKPSTTSCVALSSDPDSTNTEKYVTYNEGKSGSSITQSTLGWVSPTNYANRGCKSQNGAHCLSLKGKTYPQILRFYYGADILLTQATGSCVTPQPDSSPKPPDGAPVKLDGPRRDSLVKLDGKRPGSDRLLRDGFPPAADGWTPGGDGLPPIAPGASQILEGGCQVAAGPTAAGLPWLLIGLWLLARSGRGRRG